MKGWGRNKQAGANYGKRRLKRIEKKSLTLVFLAAFLFFSICAIVTAGFSTISLTNNNQDDINPQINNNSQAAWQEYDGTDYEIFLFSDGLTTQITNNSQNDTNPLINSNGQLAWYGYDGSNNEIFFYSGSAIQQLSDNSYDNTDLQINNNGTVLWRSAWSDCEECGYQFILSLFSGGITRQVYNGYDVWDAQLNESDQVVYNTGDVFLYSGGITRNISINGNNYWENAPRMNNGGQVVWEGQPGGGDYEIFRYSGGVTSQLTNNTVADLKPQINAAGQITWMTGGTDFEIMLYSDGASQYLSNNTWKDQNPLINDSGDVVWQSNVGGADYEIMLHSGGSTAQLTSNDTNEYISQINASGQVVWTGNGIFLYNEGATAQLASSGGSPDLNASGQVVWYGSDGSDNEIFLLGPCTSERPSLNLSKTGAYWASYADYTTGLLSVNFSLANGGTNGASSVAIIGSINTNGVTLSGAPIAVGNIAAGGSAPATVKYNVPAGVSMFKSTLYATAADACGETYSYPGPVPET